MLPNKKTCQNGSLNFSANMRVVAIKLLELTQFTLILYGIGVRCDVGIFNLSACCSLFIEKSSSTHQTEDDEQ